MIKKLTFILLIAGCAQGMYAQNTEKSEKFLENKTLFEELTNVKKKQDKFNLFLNMQGSLWKISMTWLIIIHFCSAVMAG